MSLQAIDAHDAMRSLAIDPDEMRIAICPAQNGNEFPREQKAKRRKNPLTALFQLFVTFREGWAEAEKRGKAKASDRENAEEPLRYWERPSWID